MCDFTVEDLKAIHKDGTLDPAWCATAQAQLDSTKKLEWKLLEKPPKKCVLGVGTHGKVWRAVDPRSGRQFAVKNLRQVAAKREIEVFERLRANPHPFVVQLFLVQNFDEEKVCCLVMEACSGGDLMKTCKKLRDDAAKEDTVYFMPPAQAQVWVAQVFLGLEFMHKAQDTLFRDLKPGNVLIDESSQVKLADFGVSRLGAVSSGAWTFGGPTGSPAYIAPEILKQAPTDYKADFFSLGVLTWVLLTGGLSEYPDPQPPSNVRSMKGENFEALFEDWKLFQDAVSDQSGAQAPPVTGEAQDLILQLSRESPADRPDHDAVRGHPYLGSLELPANEVAPILDWLAKVAPAA